MTLKLLFSFQCRTVPKYYVHYGTQCTPFSLISGNIHAVNWYLGHPCLRKNLCFKHRRRRWRYLCPGTKSTSFQRMTSSNVVFWPSFMIEPGLNRVQRHSSKKYKSRSLNLILSGYWSIHQIIRKIRKKSLNKSKVMQVTWGYGAQ